MIGYRGRSPSLHDNRMLELLKESNSVTAIFGKQEFPKNIHNYKSILLGPLSDDWNLDKIHCNNIIGISWGYDINEEIKNPAREQNIIRNLSKCHKLIVDSHYGKNFIKNNFKFLKNILVVPYGCDYDKYSSVKTSNKKNIAILRNWSELHNNEIILDALKDIDASLYGNINIGGTGPEKKRILGEKSYEKIKNKFKVFEGNPPNSLSILEDSSIYISACKSDGTSVSLLEAMAAGRIVLTTDFPTNLEWIEPNVNGFVFKNNSISSLQENIATILSLDNKSIERITRNARATIAEKGNWQRNKIDITTFIRNK